MPLLREIWRTIRHATGPVRRLLMPRRDPARREEARAQLRRRKHVLVDLITEHCHGESLRVAEVGVASGITSAYLVERCPQIGTLFAVDLVAPPPDSPIWGQARVEFIKGYSDQVAARFDDESLDLVFIDADHGGSAVQVDLKAWVPKVKPGGVISGHDYGSRTHTEVKPVVDAFFRDHPHPIHEEANRVFWTLK